MVPQETIRISLRYGSDMVFKETHEMAKILLFEKDVFPVNPSRENMVQSSVFQCRWTGHFFPLE